MAVAEGSPAAQCCFTLSVPTCKPLKLFNPPKQLAMVPGTQWGHPAQHRDRSPARWSSQKQLRGGE